MLLKYYESDDAFKNYSVITGIVYWRFFVFLGAGYDPAFNFSQTIKMWDTKYKIEMSIDYKYGKRGEITITLISKF